MLHRSPSPGAAGSELAHLLACMAGTGHAPSRSPFAERLGVWLGWPGAIALSAALNAGPAQPASGRWHHQGNAEADFQRVRAGLEAAIAAGPTSPRRARPTSARTAAIASPSSRRCRRPWRAAPAAARRAGAAIRPGARLAAIDAVLDQALAAHERSLLGLVPCGCRRTSKNCNARPSGRATGKTSFATTGDRVLQAELAHRLLPAQGLLDTLRTTEPT
jgi:hypothetical protein